MTGSLCYVVWASLVAQMVKESTSNAGERDLNPAFNSDDYYIYCCGQESFRRNGVALTVKKRVQTAVLGCNLKNNRMIMVHFQGKPFNIKVIQVYDPTTNVVEAEIEQFCED